MSPHVSFPVFGPCLLRPRQTPNDPCPAKAADVLLGTYDVVLLDFHPAPHDFDGSARWLYGSRSHALGGSSFARFRNSKVALGYALGHRWVVFARLAQNQREFANI